MRNRFLISIFYIWLSGLGTPVFAGDLLVGITFPGGIREFDSQSGKFLGYFGEVHQNAREVNRVIINPATGNILIIARLNQTLNRILEFDGNTGAFMGEFGQTGSPNTTNPRNLIFNPVSGNLIVMEIVSGQPIFKEFEGATGNFIGVFSNPVIPGNPSWSSPDLVFHPVTGNLIFNDVPGFVPPHFSTLYQVDGTTGALLPNFGQLQVGLSPATLVFHPTNGNLIAADDTSGVFELDGTTGTLLGPFGQFFSVAGDIRDIAIHPGTNNFWVIDNADKSIKEFDGTTGNFIRIIHEGLEQMGTLLFRTPGGGGPNLKVVETGDFNGDGFSDLLLADPVDGTLAIAFLNGIQISNLQEFTTLDPVTGWQIRGTDDFNNDGKADIHIFNTDSQLTGALIMDGFNITSVEFFHQEN